MADKMTDKMSAAVAASLASGGTESVNFLNDMVKQLWPYINVAGAKITKEIVEPMFEQMLPGPLSSMAFTKIDLGPKPITFDNVDVHNAKDDVIKLDLDILWDSECDIQLHASIVGSFGVRSIKLAGRISVVMTPLVGRLPIVGALQIAFINPPSVRVDFTGFAEIAEFSLIEKTTYKVIDSILKQALVLPNRLLFKLDPSSSWYDIYQGPIGILRLTVESGDGFKIPKQFFKDIPDVFCKVRVGAQDRWKTSVIKNSVTPEWNETKDFLLTDHDQKIHLIAYDSDFTTRDDCLGEASVTVGKLLLLEGRTKKLSLVTDNIDGGAKIRISAQVLPLIQDQTSLDDPEFGGEDRYCGLVTVLISRVQNLPVSREEAASCVKVDMFGESFSTMVVKDSPPIDPLNPIFDKTFVAALSQEMVQEAPDIVFTLVNHRTKLGVISVPFSDVRGADGGVFDLDSPLGNGAVIHARVKVHGVKPAE